MNHISRTSAEYLLKLSGKVLASTATAGASVALGEKLTLDQLTPIIAAFHEARSLNERLIEALTANAEVDPLAADVERAEAMIGRAP